jgi:hypothetical protein
MPGMPLANMSSDLTFTASQLGVSVPPLPFSTKEEFQLFARQMKENPSPTKTRIQEMAPQYRDLSNGATITPKIPSMVKTHLERWKANQRIRQLRDSTRDNFSKILHSLGAQRAAIPMTRLRHQQQDDPSKSVTPQLQQFVPPLTAPEQTAEVKTCKAQENRPCVWKPLCLCLAKDCGGWQKSNCKNYGSRWRKAGPTDEEIRTARKKPKPDRDCCWWPHCCAGVLQCSGYNLKQCKVYGTDGLLEAPAMESLEVKTMREARRRTHRVAKQRLRRYHKSKLKIQQGIKMLGGVPATASLMTDELLLQTPNTSVVVVAGSSPFVLLEGEPLIIPGPVSPGRATVNITLHDIHEMLQSGSLLNDQVMNGYMNLLGAMFVRNLGLRVVSTYFYSKITQSTNSWNQVNRWVREIGHSHTNWENAPIIAIPIFLGPNSCGHWKNLLVDRSASTSLPGGL